MVDHKWREDEPRDTAPGPVGAWHVPVAVETITEAGQHFDLAADAATRALVARVAGLRELPRLEATFDVTRRGTGGVHVAGHVAATVGQNCVVTLEPLVNQIEETVDLLFMPPRPGAGDDTDADGSDVNRDDLEPLIGGMVDLGALAAEFLILGINPYPRKPDAVFELPVDDQPEASPFAVLAKLKGQNGE